MHHINLRAPSQHIIPNSSIATPPIFYVYLAKWKSHVSNHFIPTIFSTLHPGYPYVNGANHKNPNSVATTMVVPTARKTSWSWSLITTAAEPWPFSHAGGGAPRGSLAGMTGVPGTTTPGDTGPSKPREKRNWARAPVTRQDAKWAGR